MDTARAPQMRSERQYRYCIATTSAEMMLSGGLIDPIKRLN
jgi:hypothetical protein